MANGMTTKALEAKWRGADRWLTDGGSRGAGRLVAKIAQNGATFYFQYFDAEKRKRFLPIGPHDARGERGKTLQQARDRAHDYSEFYRGGVVDLHAHFEREREAEERARRVAQEAARREQEAAQRATLRQLLDAYIAHLEGAGKQAAGDARRIFSRHVFEAAPDLASKKAAEITKTEFVELIRVLVKAGKGRTAAKLRSYLRAAYSLALQSENDPAAALGNFGIEANPLASINALSQFNRARDRNLSAEELRAFVKRLEAVPAGCKRDAVELCLLLGGQRPAQLLRVRPVDVDLSAATVTLYDSKGSRKQPRPHVLPLTKKARGILDALLERDDEEEGEAPPFIFTSDGKTAMRSETVSAIVTEISAAMLKAKEAREGFEMRDLRRTCETMLAALGVSKDIRGQLQSHGLGGVQARHYDRHEYMLEKRAALEKWQRHLDALMAGKSAKVVALPRRKAS
jgi:integrase